MFRPRIFISYAREDTELAESIRDALIDRGFAVFFDSDAMLAGEDFVERLTGELRRSDAVVALITPASTRSEWCQAEWYFAHAQRLRVIPIRSGEVDATLPAPIRLLENRIHFLEANGTPIPNEIARQLTKVRRRSQIRTILRVLALIAAIGGAGWLAVRSEWLIRAYQRAALVRRIAQAAQPIDGEAIGKSADRWTGDDALLGTVLRLVTDREATTPARLNALMLSADLLRLRRSETQWVVKNAQWDHGVIDGGSVANVTFQSGNISDLKVRGARMSMVFFDDKLSLANASFTNVTFAGGGFTGTNAISANFISCLFYGVEIDVRDFGVVSFRSAPENNEHPTLVESGKLCAFENSVIVNRKEKPAKGVVDMSEPKDEVQFERVVFTGVRFRGWIRPEWFNGCTFERCTLPSRELVAALEARGNRVTDSSIFDESVY